jgi:hypothetical protein
MCSKLLHGQVCSSATASGTRASERPRRLDGGRTGCRDGKKAAGAASSAECGHTLRICLLLGSYYYDQPHNCHQPRLDLICARITRLFGFSFLPSLELRPLMTTLLISHPKLSAPIPSQAPSIYCCFPALAIPMVLIRTIYPLVCHPFPSFHSQLCGLLYRSVPSSSSHPSSSSPPPLLVGSSHLPTCLSREAMDVQLLMFAMLARCRSRLESGVYTGFI